jgi:hypothetical protein
MELSLGLGEMMPPRTTNDHQIYSNESIDFVNGSSRDFKD